MEIRVPHDTRSKSSTVTPVQMSEILSNSEVVKGQNPIPPQVEGIGNGLPNTAHGQVAIRVVDGTISLHRRELNMKWFRMFSAAFALTGMMASTHAGLFGSGGCKSCGCAEDCQPACC